MRESNPGGVALHAQVPSAAFTLAQRFRDTLLISKAHARNRPNRIKSQQDLVEEGYIITPKPVPQCQRALTPTRSFSAPSAHTQSFRSPRRMRKNCNENSITTPDSKVPRHEKDPTVHQPAVSRMHHHTFGTSTREMGTRQFLSRLHVVDACGRDSPGPQYVPTISAVCRRSPAYAFSSRSYCSNSRGPGTPVRGSSVTSQSQTPSGTPSKTRRQPLPGPDPASYNPQYRYIHTGSVSGPRWYTPKPRRQRISCDFYFKNDLIRPMSTGSRPPSERKLHSAVTIPAHASQTHRSECTNEDSVSMQHKPVTVTTAPLPMYTMGHCAARAPHTSSISRRQCLNFFGSAGWDSPGPVYNSLLNTFGSTRSSPSFSFASRDPEFDRDVLHGATRARLANGLSRTASLREAHGVHSPGPAQYAPRSHTIASRRVNEPKCRVFQSGKNIRMDKDALSKCSDQINVCAHRKMYNADSNTFVSKAHNSCRLGRGSATLQHTAMGSEVFTRTLSNHRRSPQWTMGGTPSRQSWGQSSDRRASRSPASALNTSTVDPNKSFMALKPSIKAPQTKAVPEKSHDGTTPQVDQHTVNASASVPTRNNGDLGTCSGISPALECTTSCTEIRAVQDQTYPLAMTCDVLPVKRSCVGTGTSISIVRNSPARLSCSRAWLRTPTERFILSRYRQAPAFTFGASKIKEARPIGPNPCTYSPVDPTRSGCRIVAIGPLSTARRPQVIPTTHALGT